MKALLYLEIRQFINSIKNTARSPKRLIPTVLIGGWILLVIIQELFAFTKGEYMQTPSMEILRKFPMDQIWTVIFMLLTMVAGIIVYNAVKEGLMVFAPPYIDFMFPTPIKRRSVLGVKLLRDYIKFAFYIVLFTTIFGSDLYMVFGAPPFPGIIVTWFGVFFLIVFFMNITHILNIVGSFGIRRLQMVRHAVRLGMIIIVLIIAGSAAVHFTEKGDILASFVAATRDGIARIILSPVSWCTDLVFTPIMGITSETYEQLFWLFLLSVGSVIVLLGRTENIYEPSLGISAKMARMRRAARSGDMAALRVQSMSEKGRKTYDMPPLPPFGRGAGAILWKNLVVGLRGPSKSMLFILLLLPLGALALKSFVDHKIILQYSPLAIPYVVWMLIFTAGMELRGELKQANIIKAMPISSLSLITVAVFSSWLLIFVVVLVASLSVLILIPEASVRLLAIAVVGSLTVGFVAVASLSIPILVYPDMRDWVQGFIAQMFSFFLVGLVIAPSVLVVVLMSLFNAGTMVIILSFVVLNAVLAWCALSIDGALLRRFDPTD